ncbi:phosphatidylinositol mannoside acyltransferase [Actinoplanes palleronii]|uniref:Lipid A biosynthesis lauroyl acyltransferase n=1 Tax=Actinoplanes palleronii TaxID=113570 RepID=A0ABQ4BQC6_9ACTN|nr:phosphatidylinositol mannoside acyltransferase [Actinoplanes palleronii]GIE72875.1 lipid A biosynthesis lauroyl acyltransferase [Actinoplanes palleronii]
MGEDLSGRLYGVAWWVTPRLPGPVAALAFDAVAAVMRRSGVGGVHQLRVNLAQVLGQPADSTAVTATADQGVHSYLRYWREFFGLAGWSPDRIRDTVVFESLDRVAAARDAGRGVVLALPHSGNWDLAGAALVLNGHRFTTVAERLRPERLYQRFVSHRAALGIEVLPADETRRAITTITQRLRAGEVVCLVADRDTSAAGIGVRFCDAPTTFPAGPAQLALRAGAALMPATLWYDGPQLRVRIHPEIVPGRDGTTRARVAAMTQELADVFTDAVRRHPHDWHVLQPVWPAPAQQG